MKIKFYYVLVAIMLSCHTNYPLSGHTPGAWAASSDEQSSYPKPNELLGEKLYPDEASIAHQIADVIAASIRRQSDVTGKAVRDAHPKADGCVTAKFKIEDDLHFNFNGKPLDLAHGAFQPGVAYDAWIRFSNADADPTRDDIEPDGRGMAIKLTNVPGAKLMQPGSDDNTQDFIMISYPVFFINNPSDYLAVIRAVNPSSALEKVTGYARLPLALGFRGLKIAKATTSLQIANPLQARYWSMVPYQLGMGADSMVVKYSARSCTALQDPIPADPQPNYLRDAMRSALDLNSGQVACMEFLVQPRTKASQDVEDSTTEWLEGEAPFYKVATIEIPKQIFDTPEQNQKCENFSFNPWHALPDHKPLGAVNRMRYAIYPEISALRKSINGVPSTNASDPAPQGSQK